MKNVSVCYCRKDIMSMCTAGSPQQQTACCFYEKSGHADRCMYYVFEEYCDCLKAQLHVQKTGVAMQAEPGGRAAAISGIY